MTEPEPAPAAATTDAPAELPPLTRMPPEVVALVPVLVVPPVAAAAALAAWLPDYAFAPVLWLAVNATLAVGVAMGRTWGRDATHFVGGAMGVVGFALTPIGVVMSCPYMMALYFLAASIPMAVYGPTVALLAGSERARQWCRR